MDVLSRGLGHSAGVDDNPTLLPRHAQRGGERGGDGPQHLVAPQHRLVVGGHAVGQVPRAEREHERGGRDGGHGGRSSLHRNPLVPGGRRSRGIFLLSHCILLNALSALAVLVALSALAVLGGSSAITPFRHCFVRTALTILGGCSALAVLVALSTLAVLGGCSALAALTILTALSALAAVGHVQRRPGHNGHGRRRLLAPLHRVERGRAELAPHTGRGSRAHEVGGDLLVPVPASHRQHVASARVRQRRQGGEDPPHRAVAHQRRPAARGG